MQSVYTLQPLTKQAQDWIDENVESEPYNWLGQRLVVGYRFIGPIAEGMIEAGLEHGEDFVIGE